MEANVSSAIHINTTSNSSISINSTIVDLNDGLHINVNVHNVLVTIILVLVIFGTIVGNILVCVAVCLVRKLRRPCNYLLVSLAVSDLCVAVLVMPMGMVYEINSEWPFGEITCNLWVSFDVLSCTASILNLCMISVDRYYAITKPLEYGVKRTPARMIMCVFLVWLGAACISVPPLLILGNEHGSADYPACVVCQLIWYQLYATLCSFYIPLVVMMVVYYKIFRAARKIVLDEKRAQYHLEAHCYLEISVKNGGGPPESKISSQNPQQQQQSQSPAAAAVTIRANHRSSSTSSNTTCSLLDKASSFGRCFKSRRSHESQCPMLATSKQQQQATTPTLTPTPILRPSLINQHSSNQNTPSKHQDIITSNTNTPSQKKLRFQLAKERKASTTLGIIMSAFTICWLPFFVLALIRPFLDGESAVLRVLGSWFLWLGYANSLLNPIIYATLNRDFRKPFQEILYFRCGNLNHMMREEFYHSQYGDPDHHITTRCHLDYDEGVEYIEADGEGVKVTDVSAAHESFL